MKTSSEKKFGILFFIVFLIIGISPIFTSNSVRFWSLSLAVIFLIISYVNPSLLKPLNQIWIKFGELLGRFIAPIAMLIIFFFILTPISLIVRIFKKDLLNCNFSKKRDSYWYKREKNLRSMDKQF